MFKNEDRDSLSRIINHLETTHNYMVSQLRSIHNRLDEHIGEVRDLRQTIMRQRDIDMLERIQKFTEKMTMEQRVEFLEFIFSSIEPEELNKYIKEFKRVKGVKE